MHLGAAGGVKRRKKSHAIPPKRNYGIKNKEAGQKRKGRIRLPWGKRTEKLKRKKGI